MISVIMPTYNKANYLNLTLASFVNQTEKEFEIVIIDDGSQDHTSTVIDCYKEKLNLVYLKQVNSGRSAARNKGIEACSGNYLLFNDDDRIVHQNFVAQHKAALMTNPNAVHLGAKERILTIWSKNKLILQPNDIKVLAEKWGDQWKEIRRSNYVELVKAEQLENSFEASINKVYLGKEFETDHVLGSSFDQIPNFRLMWMMGTTANLSVIKAAVVDVGMFDTAFKGWGMEDTELCYRLYNYGLPMRDCMTALNYHQVHPIGRRFFFIPTLSYKRWIELHRNINYFDQKFKTPSSYIFRKAFYRNMSPIVANEVLTQFEDALEADPRSHQSWDTLYRRVMKGRTKSGLIAGLFTR